MRARVVLALLLGLFFTARAEANLLPAPVRRAIAPVTRAISKQTLRLSVKTTTTLDHVEAKLGVDHPGLAEAIARSRKAMKPLSPARLAGFATKHVKQNPALVPTYLAISLPLDAARLYTAASLPPAIGGAFYALSAVPATLTSLFSAEHATRMLKSDGARPTLGETTRGLLADYRTYNDRQDRRLRLATRALETPVRD